MSNINIQIGGKPHIDGQIDNPEFYYQAMDIIHKFHTDHNRAIIEKKAEEDKIKREMSKTNVNVWVYVVVGVLWLVLISRFVN